MAVGTARTDQANQWPIALVLLLVRGTRRPYLRSEEMLITWRHKANGSGDFD
jgi:hypothetical protein